MNPRAWRLTLAAAALTALVVGTRSAFGLFVSPLNTATGAGLASLSLALALGQLAVGFTQPLVGAMSDRFGAARVIVAGSQVLIGFAVLMGASYMATLPPTSQLVARQHGVQRLGTLFGVAMLVHQCGSFAGIWFGGWVAQATGADTLSWAVDIVLALGAAVLVWPRAAAREPRAALARA
jgi:MFS family permease